MALISPKFGFNLGPKVAKPNLELQIQEAPTKHEVIQAIDNQGRIKTTSSKKKEKPIIPLSEGWVGKYKLYEYQKVAKIARGEMEPEIESENLEIIPKSDDVTPILLDDPNSIDETSYSYIMSLPPLLRNRPPGLDKIDDEREKFLYDVNCRPEVASLDAYEKMPLEKFGEAMLRGMGWSEGVPIGKNATHVQQVIQLIKQPERLGLGAQPRVVQKKRPEGWIPKPGESRDPEPIMALPKDKDGRVRHYRTIDEPLKRWKEPFSVGSRVYITGGSHAGLTATISFKQDENCIVILPSDERTIVGVSNLRQLDDDEPAPTSLPPSKSSEPPSKKSAQKRSSSPPPSKSYEPPSKKKRSASPPSSLKWVIPDICVKICSKSLENGKFYCKRGWVVDVLPGGKCLVRVDGKLLEGIEERDLETVVPAVKDLVRVVLGKYKGELGRVYEKDKEKGIVYVQLEEDLEVVKLHFDDVAAVRE